MTKFSEDSIPGTSHSHHPSIVAHPRPLASCSARPVGPFSCGVGVGGSGTAGEAAVVGGWISSQHACTAIWILPLVRAALASQQSLT